MSWNILPKNVLQYFLEKIKSKFMLILNHDILGAKNILPFPYAYGTGTHHGLTITVNDDGSITAQGVPTQTLSFLISNNIIEDLALWQGSEMIFSEWEVDNQDAFAALLLGQSTPISEVRGDYKLTVTSEMIQQGVAFILYFEGGVDLTTPITFKPMVRLATDPDHTWRSPALTNKQLTDRVFYLNYAKSHVSANPSATTGTLTGIEIDGTGYTFPGSSSVTGVKGSAEQNYRTGNVNLSASDVSALGFSQLSNVSTLDDFVSLLNLSSGLGFSGRVKINADIGVGVTGWCRVIALSQNSPNNQQYALGMFCIFFPADSSNVRWALIDGHTTGSYTVTGTGTLPYTDHTYNFSGSNFHSGNGSSEEHNANNAVENGHYYYTSNGPATSLGAQSTDGGLYVQGHSANWCSQIAQDYRDGELFVRSKNNGTWQNWKSVVMEADSVSNVTMDDVATYGSSMGMVNLKSADANKNPNNQTGWHHFINISYKEHNGSNMWQTQFAIRAGTSDVYVRSRSGGSVNGNAWAAPWVRLAKAGENVGNFYNNVGYITGINKTMVVNALGYTPPTSDTNNAVTQTNTTDSANYRLLYSATADDTTRTEGARKGRIYFNPSNGMFWASNGSNQFQMGNNYLYLNGKITLIQGGNQQLTISATTSAGTETNYRVALGVYNNSWAFKPFTDKTLTLGQSSERWGQIYSSNSAISTSDRKEKKDIVSLDEFARTLIMSLNPVSYKFKDGESGRTHYGMIAQDVEDSLEELGITPKDIAAFCKDKKLKDISVFSGQRDSNGNPIYDKKQVPIPGEFTYGLRYEEFIAPIIKTEQLQQEDINSLKEEISLLKEEMALLKQRLQILEDK